MTRISASDQILFRLHEQLRQLEKNRGKRPESTPTGTTRGGPLQPLHSLLKRKGVSPEDIERALVRGLLAEQFGDAVANDPAFQAISAAVARIIQASPEGRTMIDQALRRLDAASA